MRSTRWIEDFLSDVRFGIRTLERNPGFFLTAILTLALPIGATAAAISALYAILIAPLPFHKPEELAVIWQIRSNEPLSRYEVAPGNYVDWKQRAGLFRELAALNPYSGVTLTGYGEPERLEGARVSSNFFRLLGRTARIGRTFLDSENQEGHDRVAVINDSLWRRRFAADPNILGRTVTFDGTAHTIVGVLPASFPVRAATPDLETSTRDVEVWRPLVLNAFQRTQRDQGTLRVIGRLTAGTGIGAAQNEMSAISRDLEKLYPATNRGWGVQIVPLAEQTVGQMSPVILLSSGAIGLTLILACVSVGGMLLARAIGRRRELAARVAMGAGRARIIRQLLTESLVLTFAGGALGIAFGYGIMPFLRDSTLIDLPRREEIAIRVPALLLSFGAIIAAAIACGTVPLFRVSRELTGHGRGVTAGRQHRTLGSLLVAVQVAIACVLLAGTGLLVRTLANLRSMEAGFEPNGKLTLQVTLPRQYYPDAIGRVAFFSRIGENIRQLPGVFAVGSSSSLPFMKRSDEAAIPYFANGSQTPAGIAGANSVSPSFFGSLGIPLLEGRLFTPRDDRQSPLVITVNQAFAAQTWQGRNPIGQQVSVEEDSNHSRIWRTVVGMVGNVRPFGLDSPEQPIFYLPLAQFEVSWQMFVVQSSQDPGALAREIRRVVESLDPRQPIHNIQPMSAMIDGSLGPRKAVLGLLAALGIMAIVVAGIGLYGLLAYQVQQGRKEIGIRSALGASPARILRLLLVRTLILTGFGISAGLICASVGGRALASLLFGVQTFDATVYLGCAATLLCVALVASAAPAYRALRVNAAAELRRD